MFQPFTFIFAKSNSLMSKVIRKVSKSKFSHVAMTLDSLHTLELTWKLPCVIQHFSYSLDRYEIYQLNIDLTEEQQKTIKNFIKINIASGYDKKFVISRGMNLLFGTKIKNSEHLYSCDELIVDAFSLVGIELLDKDVFLTPDSLSKSRYLTKID
ncbi:hypothetical protein [Bacillus infantis]|uniref:hypothetical protein n=1 Tax=Bacillus infantis TaxID=324767 RepID=UPI00209FB0CF|nr:hypothetical protein [Bacillus infantis]MCP1159464.1 hypothetical protein [Bacillus infantis]